jgi:hypothetical protein
VRARGQLDLARQVQRGDAAGDVLDHVTLDPLAQPADGAEGGVVRVVSREGLISLKAAAGRPQDIADLKRLEELGRG